MTQPAPATNRLNPNAGLTLIESTIVLAIVSVIIAAVWSISSVVYENAHQYQANRQMQTLVQNIRQLYARVNALTTDGDVTATLDTQEAFPREMRLTQSTASDKLNHPWASQAGGSVRVYNRLSVNPRTFGIVFTNLPKKACIGLATKLTGGEITNLNRALINGAVVSSPVTLVTATSQCNAAGDTNTIEWQFDIRA